MFRRSEEFRPDALTLWSPLSDLFRAIVYEQDDWAVRESGGQLCQEPRRLRDSHVHAAGGPRFAACRARLVTLWFVYCY